MNFKPGNDSITMARLKNRAMGVKNRTRAIDATQPKPPKAYQKRIEVKVKISKEMFLEALSGTYGSRRLIAKKLRIPVWDVYRILKQPDWADVNDAVQIESGQVRELAESTLIDCMTQREHIGTASATARWLLERTDPKYRNLTPQSAVQVNVNQTTEQKVVAVKDLNLSIEARKELLRLADEKGAETLDIGHIPTSHSQT